MPSARSEQTLDVILAHFRENARSNRERGDLFERLIAHYLLADPKYDFEHVWLWGEWPHRWSVDTGIDLVAQERATGEFWAIQCKFYLPEHWLVQGDLNSFFNTSGKRFAVNDRETSFTARLIVTTTDRISKHAEDSFADQSIPTTRLSIRDLEDSCSGLRSSARGREIIANVSSNYLRLSALLGSHYLRLSPD